MADVKVIIGFVTKILDKVLDLHKVHNIPVDEYTNQHGVTYRVYKCAPSDALVKLTKLSSKGKVGDGDIQIMCASFLGRENFDYTTDDGFKFAFASIKGSTIEIRFKLVKDTSLPELDGIDDIDIDID